MTANELVFTTRTRTNILGTPHSSVTTLLAVPTFPAFAELPSPNLQPPPPRYVAQRLHRSRVCHQWSGYCPEVSRGARYGGVD